MTVELGTVPALQNLSSLKEGTIFCRHVQCVEWLTIWISSWFCNFYFLLFPLHHRDIRPVTANCEAMKLCFKGPSTLRKITANNNCCNSIGCIQPDEQYYDVNIVPSIHSLMWLHCQLFLQVIIKRHVYRLLALLFELSSVRCKSLKDLNPLILNVASSK